MFAPRPCLALLVLCLAAASLRAQDDRPHPRSGVFTDQLEDEKTDRLIIRYKMRAPDPLPEAKHLGLIVYFHGRGGDENSLYNLVTRSLERLGLIDQYVVMGGKSKADGWTPADDEFVLQWIEWAKQTYPIDPRRVHVVGYSSGAFMVTRFGWEHQELFATVGAFCGASNQNPSRAGGYKAKGPTGAADTKTEFYYIHGTMDDQVDVALSRNSVKKLAERGYRYIYRELDGHDHGSIGRVDEISDDLFRFMHASRLKEMPLSKEDRSAMSAAKTALRKASEAEAQDHLNEVARVGGIWGAKPLSTALRSGDDAIKIAAVRTFGQTMYSRAAVKELTRLLRDKSEAVRLETIRSLGACANWRYDDAQKALCRFAKTASNAASERAAAVHALTPCVRLMLRGNMEDGLIPYTLAQLLGDEAVEVRTAAFAAFKDRVKDDYNYRPDLSEGALDSAVKRWTDWVKEASGSPEALNNIGVQSIKP